jgi:hypothetical protein
VKGEAKKDSVRFALLSAILVAIVAEVKRKQELLVMFERERVARLPAECDHRTALEKLRQVQAQLSAISGKKTKK